MSVSLPVPPVRISSKAEPVRVAAAPVLLTVKPLVPVVSADKLTAKPEVLIVAVPLLVL